MVGVTSMLMVGFVLLSIWMTWQHESVLKQLVPAVVQLQQAVKPLLEQEAAKGKQ